MNGSSDNTQNSLWGYSVNNTIYLIILVTALGMLAAISSLFIGLEMTRLVFYVVLTAFLIRIYSNMAESEKAQVEIQSRQEQLLQAAHEPELVITEEINFERNSSIDIVLKNAGNGVATNLEICTNIEFEDEEFVSEPEAVNLQRNYDDFGDGGLSPTGNYLESGDESTYSATVSARVRNITGESDSRKPFDDIMSDLCQSGTTQVKPRVYISYTNILGEKRTVDVFAPQENIDISQFYQDNRNIEQFSKSPLYWMYFWAYMSV